MGFVTTIGITVVKICSGFSSGHLQDGGQGLVQSQSDCGVVTSSILRPSVVSTIDSSVESALRLVIFSVMFLVGINSVIEGIVLSISGISVSGSTSVGQLQLLGPSGFPNLFSQSGSFSTSCPNVVSSGAVVGSE